MRVCRRAEQGPETIFPSGAFLENFRRENIYFGILLFPGIPR